MKSFVLFSLAAAILIIGPLCTSLNAQEEDEKDFNNRIERILQNTYRSIDEQLGTYIFTDEGQNQVSNRDSESSAENTAVVTIKKDRNTSKYSFSYDYTTTTRDYYPSHLKVNSLAFYPWENMHDDILFRYNRVEGLFLGLNSPQKYNWDGHHIDLFGSGGYGFANHHWRYNGGVAQQFGTGDHLFEFGAEGHSLTDSDDKWIVSQSENNLTSILARDDYRDYYSREGVSLWAGFYRQPSTWGYQFTVAYLLDRYESLDRSTNWSIFGGEKLFHDNPSIDDGHMKSILATFEIQKLQSQRVFTSGWTAAVSAEHAGSGLQGDFTFDRYQADLRRYLPFSKYDNLNLRLHAGAATGDVPAQKLFALGGISTLPAFGYKDFTGNRIFLANAEYLVNGRMFDDNDLFPSWLLRNVNLILFMDAGYAATSTDNSIVKGFEDLTYSSLKSDWGFGFGTRDAKFRIGVAWRTDVSEPAHVFIRLDRPF